MKYGDHNTSYFHHKASQRKKRNAIDALCHNLGQQIDNDHELENMDVNYFTQTFQSQAQLSFIDNVSTTRTLTEMDILSLSAPFSRVEIIHALKHIHPKKAPRPDGIFSSSKDIGIL